MAEGRALFIPNPNNAIISGVSMATSITSPVSIIQGCPGISYDCSWTGTPTGTFSVQVTNSYFTAPNGTVINAGNWTILPTASFSGTYPVPSGSAGNGFLDIFGTEAYAVRLVYNATGGSGNLTVWAAGKGW